MTTSSLKEYLKRYESKSEEDINKNKKKKKKKKKNKKAKPESTGVLVVDEDPVWQKQINLEEEEEENESADDAKPLVDEDIEVKRMRRLEQIRARHAYEEIAEDGSGWISVSLSPKHGNVTAGNSNRSKRNDTPSPNHKVRPSTADISPPRKCRVRNDTPSPQPKEGRLSTEDMSPPRKTRTRNDTPSPEPRGRPSTREDADLSPPGPRRAWQHSPSPKTESLHSDGVDADLSPPRPQRGSGWRNAELPPSADISPPRRGRRSPLSKLDLSPPRKKREDFRRSGSPLAQDISPPRKKKIESSVAFSLKERPKTGLISGRDISEEISKIRRDDLLRFEQMDPSISGRGAEPVYRDAKGERISKEEYMKSKQKVEEKPKEIKIEWGKGLAQKREAEAKFQELELEKDKPFARSRDDPELDKMLKDRLRWGDPMAHLVKKKHSEVVLPNFGDNEKMKESGFIIPQDIPSHSWIKRGVDAAPNRYGIKPGRHWDGVDRSNGYEKQLFKRLNEKQATEKEAYLWSVSEM